MTDGSATEHIFAGNRRIATKTGSSINYYHPDHLGGLNIATNGSGTVRQTTFYYPYGETRVNTGSVDLHYKFTGKEIDRESGLYYYGARYYDPVIGRFISADSVVQSPSDPQTLNRYSYAANNPLANIDPTGHSWFSVALNWFSDNVLEPMSAAFAGAVVGTFAGPGVGGIVAGAIMGAYSGNLTNVIVSAATAGMMGGMPYPVNLVAQAGLFGYSVAKNGPNALGSFAGGFVGGLSGSMAGQAFGEAMNQTINGNLAGAADYQSNVAGPAGNGGSAGTNYTQANANVPSSMHIPQEVQDELAPYFAGRPPSWDSIILHKGIPWYVHLFNPDAIGYTGSSTDIYWNPAKLLYGTNPDFVSVIGHELVHTFQYLDIPNFQMNYLTSSAFRSAVETPAYNMQSRIYQDLTLHPN